MKHFCLLPAHNAPCSLFCGATDGSIEFDLRNVDCPKCLDKMQSQYNLLRSLTTSVRDMASLAKIALQ